MAVQTETYCPNFQICRLVTTDEVVDNHDRKERYISQFCHSYHNDWETCKRFITKNALQACPDFVLPDSKMSVAEILDKWDEELQ